jgi:hypothetical protein
VHVCVCVCVCVIAQAVSRQLPTVVAQARDQGKLVVGSVVAQVALGQVFSKYFGFPANHSFHQLLHSDHHLSSNVDTTGQ